MVFGPNLGVLIPMHHITMPLVSVSQLRNYHFSVARPKQEHHRIKTEYTEYRTECMQHMDPNRQAAPRNLFTPKGVGTATMATTTTTTQYNNNQTTATATTINTTQQ